MFVLHIERERGKRGGDVTPETVPQHPEKEINMPYLGYYDILITYEFSQFVEITVCF